MILFPVFQSPHNILFRVVKLVGHIGNTGGKPGSRHPEKIQINFQLGVVGVFHVFVYKDV